MTESKTPRTTAASKVPAIYKALHSIQSGIDKIEKNGKNTHFNYTFVSNDDILAAVSAGLKEHNVIVRPTLTTEYVERPLGNNKVLPVAVANLEQEYIAVEDGSSITTNSVGEGAGNDDKALRKAVTQAQKIANLLTFSIATGEPDPDSGKGDASEHAVSVSVGAPAPQSAPSDPLAPHKTKIVSLLKARGDIADGDDIKAKVKELGDAYFNSRPGWDTTEAALKKWATSLEKGEVK